MKKIFLLFLVISLSLFFFPFKDVNANSTATKDVQRADEVINYESQHKLITSNNIYTAKFQDNQNLIHSHTWIPYFPQPEQVGLEVLVSEKSIRVRVIVTFSHAGFRVNWGSMTRCGETFRADAQVEMWTGPALQVVTVEQHEYDLGPLDHGFYRTEFQVWGKPISSIKFNVPAKSVSIPIFTSQWVNHHESIAHVQIYCPTPGAVIRYTTDGTQPTELSPVVESGATVELPVPGTLKAKAWKTGLVPSATRISNYLPQRIVLELSETSWLSAFYVAYFGRPGIPQEIKYWVDMIQSGNIDLLTVAEKIGLSQEAKDIYPYLSAPGKATRPQITDFVRGVYQNLMNLFLEEDSESMLFWVDELIQGSLTPGAFIGHILYSAFLEDGADWQTVLNKVQVAEYFSSRFDTLDLDWLDKDADLARQVIEGVTGDHGTVIKGKEMVILILSDCMPGK